MSFTDTREILQDAADRRYAVGAFNICSLDQSSALINMAVSIGSAILVTIPAVIEPYVDFAELGAVTKCAAEKASVPVGLHLSHGTDFGSVERAIDAGFTSVMFDGSKLPLEENIRLTREAVRMGHSRNVAVEGELGSLGGSADMMTDPDSASQYVKETDIDILAVAIGNAHGFYKGTPKLDFERLVHIRNAISSRKNVFLTLHGGTGIPDHDMKMAISEGITKICIYTEMCNAGKNNAMAYLAGNPEYQGNYDVPELIKGISSGFADTARSFMEIFSSKGKSGGSGVSTDQLDIEEIKSIIHAVINNL